MPKQADAKRDSLLNLQSNFNKENVDVLNTLRINRSRPQNLATCALGDSQKKRYKVVYCIIL